MRKLLCALLGVALALGAGSLASAQGTSAGGKAPLLIVSFSGYNGLRANIETVGKLAGKPDLATGLEGMLTFLTQGKGVAGLDKTRPWGAVVYAGEGMDFPIYGYIPVTDLKALMAVSPNPETGKPFEPNAEGIYEIGAGGQKIYVAQKGNWAFLVNNPEALKTAPADPSTLIGDLAKKYTVAIRASVKNVPEGLREMAMMQARAVMEMGMQQMPGEADEQYAIRANVAKQSLEKIATLVKELDELLLGIGVDVSQGSAYLDFEVTAKPGTKTAQQFATMKDAKTNFAGFLLPDAAVTGNFAGSMDAGEAADTKKMVATFRAKILKELEGNNDLSKEQAQLAKQMLGDMFDVLDKTIDARKSDGGMALTLEPGAPTVVAGSFVAEGAKLEKVLKQLVAEVAKEQPGIAGMIKLDKENHAGVRFHVATIPIPDPQAATILGGEAVDVVIGIGDDALYLGAGKNAVATLKQVIDKSKADPGKAVPPMQVTLAGAPIAKFAAQVAEGPAKPVAGMVADLLGKAGGKDHAALVAKAIPNGVSIRLSLEEGLLKAILTMSQGGMGGGAAPPGATAPANPGSAPPAGGNPFK